MIAASRFVNIFGLVAPGDDRVIRIAAAAVAAGYAVVVDKPGQKVPLCTLTSTQVRSADRAVRAAAIAAGDPQAERRRHPCGLHHAFAPRSDPATLKRVMGRLETQYGHCNIGLELGASRMVCVDVDTAVENAAFLADWSAATGQDETGRHPTVLSPGAVDVAGTWVHKDGGHYWFALPDGVILPVSGTGVLKTDTGWCLMWAGRQVLVPPSSRPEGDYTLVAEQIEECPGWLLDMIIMDVHAREERTRINAEKMREHGPSDIDAWQAATPWALILDGWEDTGMPDTCSCPIWTAPGEHASPKSATAHDAGCSRYDVSTGWGPLHIWTDNPPEFLAGLGKTLTKLQYLAARDHAGVTRAALIDIGLLPVDEEFPGFEVERAAKPDPFTAAPPVAGPLENTGVGPEPSEPINGTPLDIARTSLMSKMLSSEDLDSIEDPQPLVTGLLDLDTVARMVGKSGHGKTFAAIDIACRVAVGGAWHGRGVRQGLVVYMVAEGARGFKKRIRAWEARHHDGAFIDRSALLVIPFPIQVTDQAAWLALRGVLRELGPVLVVMDTQARITVGVSENDATEMGIFIERVEQIRRETHACVMLVHHLGHQGEQGRGSSAVLGAVNTELRVVRERAEVTIHTDKQKDGPQDMPLVFDLDPEGDSAVLLGRDPFTTATDINPESPAVDRLIKILHETAPRWGLTKGEAKRVVAGSDKDGHGKPMVDKTFLRSWDKAAARGWLAQVVTAEGRTTQCFVVSRDARERFGLDLIA